MRIKKFHFAICAFLVGCSTSTKTANVVKDVTDTAALVGSVATGTLNVGSTTPQVEHQIQIKGFVSCRNTLMLDFTPFQLELFERDKLVAIFKPESDGGFLKTYRGDMGHYSVRLVSKGKATVIDAKEFTSTKQQDRFEIALNSCP